jgi:hypothetical protein
MKLRSFFKSLFGFIPAFFFRKEKASNTPNVPTLRISAVEAPVFYERDFRNNPRESLQKMLRGIDTALSQICRSDQEKGDIAVYLTDKWENEPRGLPEGSFVVRIVRLTGIPQKSQP